MKKAPRPGISGAKGQSLPRYHPRWTEYVPLTKGNAIDPPALYRARPSVPTEAFCPLGRMLGDVLRFPGPAAFPAPAALCEGLAGKLLFPSSPCAEYNRLCSGCQGKDKKSAGRTSPDKPAARHGCRPWTGCPPRRRRCRQSPLFCLLEILRGIVDAQRRFVHLIAAEMAPAALSLAARASTISAWSSSILLFFTVTSDLFLTRSKWTVNPVII